MIKYIDFLTHNPETVIHYLKHNTLWLKDDDFQLKWHSDYYDGPLNGFLEYLDKMYYFSMIDENDDGERTYIVCEITENDLLKEIDIHKEFEKYVGKHCNYGADYGPLTSDNKFFNEFYEKYPPQGTHTRCKEFLKKSTIIGWMTL